MQTEYTIDKVSWHTKIEDNPETPEQVRRRFGVVVAFLQSTGLTVRELLRPGELPSDDFGIRTSDLSPEGLQVMKLGYERWLKRIVNQRKDITDVCILSEAIAKARGG
jgi:hypothetical protein